MHVDDVAGNFRHMTYHSSKRCAVWSVGARGPDPPACRPSCIMMACTRCSACARAVVVTSGQGTGT
jgi:hypothetical protein